MLLFFGHGHLRAGRTGGQWRSSQRSCYLVRVEQIAHYGASQPTTFASIACRLSHQFLSLVWFGPSRPQFKDFLNKAGIVLISHPMMLDILAVFYHATQLMEVVLMFRLLMFKRMMKAMHFPV